MSSTINPNSPGTPIAVGTTFRHRFIYANRPSGQEGTTGWTVCVLDHEDGPIIDAHPAVGAHNCVAVGITADTFMLPDVLAKTLPLLDDARGWTEARSRSCCRPTCTNPLPMHDSTGRRNGPGVECLPCRARTLASCSCCGRPDDLRTGRRETLLARELCFGCAFWIDRAAQADPASIVTPNWHYYTLGTSTGPADCRGHGGRRASITFLDGRPATTCGDLWSGGTIPERHRHLFAVRAEVTW